MTDGEKFLLVAALAVGAYVVYKKGGLKFALPQAAQPALTRAAGNAKNPKAGNVVDFFNPNGNTTVRDAPQATQPFAPNTPGKLEIPAPKTGGVPFEIMQYKTDEATDPTRQFATARPVARSEPVYGTAVTAPAPEVATVRPLPLENLGQEVNQA